MAAQGKDGKTGIRPLRTNGNELIYNGGMRVLIFLMTLFTTAHATETIICTGIEESYECQKYDDDLPDSYTYDSVPLEDVIHVTESDYVGSDSRDAVSDHERESVGEAQEENFTPIQPGPYFNPFFDPRSPFFLFR